MDGAHFDWLHVGSATNSGSVLPAPQVSFGGSGPNRQQNTPSPGTFQPNTPAGYSSNAVLTPNKVSNNHPYGNRRGHAASFSATTSTGESGNFNSTDYFDSDLNQPRPKQPNFFLSSNNLSTLASLSTSNDDQNLSADRNGSGGANVYLGQANNNNNNNLDNLNNKNNPNYNSTDSDISIPLSLQTHELTFQELKTYMRWYSDILARTNARTISMQDVYLFLSNFKITEVCKEKINKIYSKILHSINIGEFFALLRLISHALNGLEPSRKLIKIQAPTPAPPSILSKKRPTEDDEEDLPSSNQSDSNSSEAPAQLDLDSFTQFMLTGERPEDQRKKKKSKKSVKFSDQIVTDVHDVDSGITSFTSPSPQPQQQDIDYSLPMDQLLGKLKQNQSKEEKEILEDMEEQINHFHGLNSVEKMSQNFQISDNQLLKPNMTGPAQMSRYFSPSPEPQSQEEFLQPNMTGPAQMARLQPNRTGPADMARLFSPSSDEQPKISLQSFTDQMTESTFNNTMQNSRLSVGNESSYQHQSSEKTGTASTSNDSNGAYIRAPAPPPVPQNRRTRSLTSPTPVSSELMYDNVNHNNNFLNESTMNDISQVSNGFLPVPPPVLPSRNTSSPSFSSSPQHGNGRLVPPPPPPSRRRTASTSALTSPPPLPPKVSIQQQYDYQDNSNINTNSNSIYGNTDSSDSTANLLTDLKALQDEVDKIRTMTGGF